METIETNASPVLPGRLFFWPLSGGALHLAASERSLEAPVLKPIDLTRSHGVKLRVADLQEMASAFNPSLVAAALNFDHSWGGPSHGWCSRLWMVGEELWARFEQLSAEAIQGIESNQWPRRSAEFWTSHPATNGFYFTGLALLGNSEPAVWGLGPARLLSGRPIHVIDLGASAPTEPVTMTDETIPPVEPVSTTTEPPAAGAVTLSSESSESAEVLELRAENQRLKAERNALAAGKDLDKLGARCTPAMRRIAEPLLAALRGNSAAVVHLSAADGTTAEQPAAETLLALLAAVPEFQALGAGETAGPAAEESARLAVDDRTDEEREYHRRFGLADERVIELRSRYPRPN